MREQDQELENIQLVGCAQGKVVVVAPRQKMTKKQALVHAAWLVTVAGVLDDPCPSFEEIIEKIRR